MVLPHLPCKIIGMFSAPLLKWFSSLNKDLGQILDKSVQQRTRGIMPVLQPRASGSSCILDPGGHSLSFRLWPRTFTPVMVVLPVASSPGCLSRHEQARSQGFPIPAENFPNELAQFSGEVAGVARSRCGLNFSLRYGPYGTEC